MYFTRYVTQAKIRDVGTLLRDSPFVVFLRLGALRPQLSATAEQALELRMEMLASPVVDCDRAEAQWEDIRKAFEHLGLTVDGLDEERPFFVAFESERLRDPGASRVPCRIAYVEPAGDGGTEALDVDEACLAAFGEIYAWTLSAERQASQNADRGELIVLLASLLAAASSTAERGDSRESSGDELSSPASPDLILQVNVTQDQGKTVLIYRLLAPTGKVAFHLEPFRGPVLDGSPDVFAAMLFEKIESLNEGLDDEDDTSRLRNAEKELADLGRWLYRKLFPPEMRAAYRKFRGVVETIQIASDEPWIPWELVKPYDDEVKPAIDDDFLCGQFELTRWLAGDKIPAPSFFVGRMAVVGAENAPGSRPLPNAAKEHEMLVALASRHPGIEPVQLPEATFDDLVNLLRRGGLGILHFIGHGDARAERPDDAKIVLKDRPFRRYNLSGDLETAIKTDQPLVFLNACRVARQGWSLSGLGGWAEAWVRTCGCGAFVGPQWMVKDSLAFEFARVFYESSEAGKTFGEAVSAAREAVRRKDPGRPTWLAYAAYGHPGARLLWSKAPKVEPQHPSEKPSTETKPIPGSPAPQKDTEKHSGLDSNVSELAQNSLQKPRTEEQGSGNVGHAGAHKPPETTTARAPGDPSATDHTVLEIVDLDGKNLLLSNPSIAYPDIFGPSWMTEGIAVRRGIEEATLLWSRIRALKFKSWQEKNDKGKTVWRHTVDATLEDGRVVSVELRDDWNMAYWGGGGTGLLFGQTDLGKTSIPFSKISLLRVLKHAQAKK